MIAYSASFGRLMTGAAAVGRRGGISGGCSITLHRRTLTTTIKATRGANSTFKAGSNRDSYTTASDAGASSILPLSVEELDNVSLFTLGETGHYEARAEIIKRHIMNVDGTSYEEAARKFSQIQEKNKEFSFLLSLPYHLGLGFALTVGFASIPLVFDLSTAHWFNHHFVTADIPEPKDLETVLEVGSWTWNWMEPPLGAMSFFLLCLQFSRAQIQNLGVNPYTETIKQWRGQRLAQAFPTYNARALIAYSKASALQH